MSRPRISVRASTYKELRGFIVTAGRGRDTYFVRTREIADMIAAIVRMPIYWEGDEAARRLLSNTIGHLILLERPNEQLKSV